MIYGLSDPHLDYTKEKKMDIFGKRWENYEEKIFERWAATVGEEDWVLIPGDISWAMTPETARADLARIDELPGKKILSRGNHDYWWASLTKIRNLGFDSITFLQNDSICVEGVNICATRGWTDKSAHDFDEADLKVYQRELIRLGLSLEKRDREKPTIVMLHYPPFSTRGEPNEFAAMLRDEGVECCVYGHLHSDGLKNVVEGLVDGVEYHCLSADYLDFVPKKLLGEERRK